MTSSAVNADRSDAVMPRGRKSPTPGRILDVLELEGELTINQIHAEFVLRGWDIKPDTLKRMIERMVADGRLQSELIESFATTTEFRGEQKKQRLLCAA